MYDVVITPEAEKEFDAEIDYSANRWGKRHALAYAKALRQVVNDIAPQPYQMHLKSLGV